MRDTEAKPVRRATPAPAAPLGRSLGGKPLGQPLWACGVLLVEDNPGDARLIAERLQRDNAHDFRLTCVDRLSTAIPYLRRSVADVVLLDLSLPDSRGVETLRKARLAAGRTPIVVLTDLDDESVAMAALRAGAQDYLVKAELDDRSLIRALRYAAQRARAEDRVAAANDRFRLLFEGSPTGLVLCSDDGRIRQANRAFERLVNCSAADLLGRSIEDWIVDGAAVLQRVRARAHGEGGVAEKGKLNRGDGTRISIELSWMAIDEPDGARRICFTVIDQTAHKRQERRLMQLSLYDPLTGLANRNLFNVTLLKALGRAERAGSKVAVLFLDLDRFKNVNDTLGHDAGDGLLAQVAGRLSAEMRVGDQVARLGGDEFAVILENIAKQQEAAVVAQKLVDALLPEFDIRGTVTHTSVSVGVSLYPDHASDAAALAKTADIAMYRAKERGGGAYCFYSESINRTATRRASFEDALRQALRRREFVLYYQPQFDLASGRIVCLEALLRWSRGGGRLVSAERFVPYLESSGLIESVGSWAIGEACGELRRWQERLRRPDLRVAVNVSSRQLARTRLVGEVRSALKRSGLQASCLELEVTETLLLANRRRAAQMLRELNEDGVTIVVDDFGTGYSSLQYLKLLPIQALKVDRSFVAGVPYDTSDVSIIKGIVALARGLGLDIIAEGIETHAQQRFLMDEGCPRAQGYLLGRPLVGDAVSNFINAHSQAVG